MVVEVCWADAGMFSDETINYLMLGGSINCAEKFTVKILVRWLEETRVGAHRTPVISLCMARVVNVRGSWILLNVINPRNNGWECINGKG